MIKTIFRFLPALLAIFVASQAWALVVSPYDDTYLYDQTYITTIAQNYTYDTASNLISASKQQPSDSLSEYSGSRLTFAFSLVDAFDAAKRIANRFPKSADDLLSGSPRDAKGRIYPSSKVRIRPEQHSLKPGETYAPRHHGQHYHVETRADPTKSWNNKKNVTKVKPSGYQPGQGTGFLPGEKFPGSN